ncbi:hypothetical protein GCM10012286_16330 [Streptomyces lasiicapitis]|uniref:Uncharacterized protein n=1 Tax=Streptomyces lasiicapitis TaxID=1923961 RepID=A0ABQ2LM46_9ACTN|nr:hypothetical protein GCM10012286_16330 [Streptomyces lasiicapitis]
MIFGPERGPWVWGAPEADGFSHTSDVWQGVKSVAVRVGCSSSAEKRRDVMRGGRVPPEGEQRGAGGGGASRVLGEHVEPLQTWGVLCSRGN